MVVTPQTCQQIPPPVITPEEEEDMLGPAAKEDMESWFLHCQGLDGGTSRERRKEVGVLVATTVALAEGGLSGTCLSGGPWGVVAFGAAFGRDINVVASSLGQHVQAREDLLDYVIERYGLVSQRSIAVQRLHRSGGSRM